MLPINSVICGDAFQVLKEFPKASVDMVLFSPSYWGLRDYSTVASLTSKEKTKVEAFQDEQFEWFAHHYPQYKYEKTDIRFNERTKDYSGSVKAIFPCVEPFAVGPLSLESHPSLYIERLVVLCRLLRRVLKKSGSMYVNMGDTYCGGGIHHGDKNLGLSKSVTKMSKKEPQANLPKSNWLQPKQLMLIPSRVAIALQDDGWILRNDIVWHKPNHMPSSVKDRLTNSWEHIFHFVKARRYFYDLDAIRKPHAKSSLERSRYPQKYYPQAWREDSLQPTPISGGKKVNLHLNPLGKNPGDTITTREDLRQKKIEKGYLISGHVGGVTGSMYPRDQQGHPLGKNPGDFLSIPTQPFPQAHFAVYPEAICEAPIKASCPAQICRACGKPRKRILKKNGRVRQHWAPGTEVKTEQAKGTHGATSTLVSGYKFTYETVGFSDCGCQKGFAPGVVLDPMCGAGTTLKVAHKLGRRWIGIDLNPSYVEMTIRGLEKIGAFSARLDKFAVKPTQE